MSEIERTVYRLQSRRFMSEWHDDEGWGYPKDQSDLDAWIQIARQCDDFEGQYDYRIVSAQNMVVWQAWSPFEPVRIEWTQSPEGWLRALQQNYGLPDDLFAMACRRWLETFDK